MFMIEITKNRVAEWMLLSYMAELKLLSDKIDIYENKYGIAFPEFEKKVKIEKTENFEMWDDFIEWKAYTNFYNKTNQIIQDVRVGNFKVA